jgi:PilZ domain-containing protein
MPRPLAVPLSRPGLLLRNLFKPPSHLKTLRKILRSFFKQNMFSLNAQLNTQVDQNRRRHLRKEPEELTFIQIERDEVGRVLNVSEGGLSFCSVTPVPRNLPVYFWFSFNLRDRIEAMGEVAWTDITRKVGGLRFTQLSQNGRQQIQQWLARARRQPIPAERPAPQPASQFGPASVPAQIRTSMPDRVTKFIAKARAYRPVFSREAAGSDSAVSSAPGRGFESMASQPDDAAESASKARPYRTIFSLEAGDSPALKLSSFPMRGIESLAELVPLQRHLSAKKRQLICGVLLGLCISAGVAVSALKYWNYHTYTQNVAPKVAESPVSKTDPSSPSPAPTAPSKPSYPVAGIFSSAPVRNYGAHPDSLAKRQMADAYRQDQLKTVAVKPPKPLTEVPTKTPGDGTPTANKKSKSMTPTQLWSAVQAGNSKAAVELAELYIKGDGVPQNCQQARVLLLVASEKRNTAAIKRLQELDKDAATCP